MAISLYKSKVNILGKLIENIKQVVNYIPEDDYISILCKN